MAGPLEQFEVSKKIALEVAGYDVSFTNSSLWMVIVVATVFGMLTLFTKKRSLVPSRLQSIAEVLYEFIADMVIDLAGPESKRYFPYIFTVFTFVLFGNLLGMLPYSFTITSHLTVTFTLALMGFLIITVIGFVHHGTKYLGLFMPGGAPLFLAPILIPIEMFAYFVRPFTLAIRLFANMLAGHIVLKIFAGFSVALATGFGVYAGFPVVIVNIAMIGFELIVAALQAYIFTLLMCTYLNDAVHMHH